MIRRFIASILVILAIVHPGMAGKVDREHQVKAAFIYNFAKYCEWPSLGSSSSPFVVGVYQTDAYGRELGDTLRGKSISGHPISVEEINDESRIPDCRIVVVGDIGGDQVGHLVRACRNSATLLVGESPNFARSGGTIGFVVESNKVHFEINLQSAKTDNIVLSSKLLSLARVVY